MITLSYIVIFVFALITITLYVMHKDWYYYAFMTIFWFFILTINILIEIRSMLG